MVREDGRVGKDHSAINTKGTTVSTRSMDLVFSLGPVGISTKESTKMMKEMAMVR